MEEDNPGNAALAFVHGDYASAHKQLILIELATGDPVLTLEERNAVFDEAARKQDEAYGFGMSVELWREFLNQDDPVARHVWESAPVTAEFATALAVVVVDEHVNNQPEPCT